MPSSADVVSDDISGSGENPFRISETLCSRNNQLGLARALRQGRLCRGDRQSGWRGVL